jgi:hypothetical protein
MTLAFTLSAFLVCAVLAIGLQTRKAFADGLTTETFSASLGDRNAQLLVKVNPPILTDASKNNAYMLFRLYDANNNQTIKATTFVISVEKGVGQNAQRILTDTFHSENGLLRLKVEPAEGEVQIFGTQEQFLNAWVADPGGTINIRGPMFLEGGIYHLRIEILGIDFIRNLFPDDKVPKFDSWLSVGDVFSRSVEYQGDSYNTTIISYYDRVKDFSFDAGKERFTWSMPFDWNVSRIQSTNIFVHEEVKIPKSLEGIGDSFTFVATASGNRLSSKMLAIDPYSSEQDLTLHYLINKNDIINMAGQVPVGTSQMTFTLEPATDENAQTTTEIFTDNGSIKVSTDWKPSLLNADTESTLTLNFFSEFASGAKINDDVNYNLRILDHNGTQVYSKTDLVAKGGTGMQKIDFPRNENYRIEVAVTGIAKDGQPADKTMNGIARGTVVVPEFQAGITLAIAGVLGMSIAILRFARKMPGW